MEDLSDLRRQVKILEEKNMENLQTKIDYEEEVKRNTMLKSHLDMCKQQLAEVHRKLDEHSNKSDKLEFEVKKMDAKMNTVQRERDRLMLERDALKETNEELRCAQLNATENRGHPTDDDTISNAESVPLEIKEKLLLLQHENKMLKLNQKGNEEKLPTVQALLEDSEERVNTLRNQNRKANQRIIELENKLEELTESQANGEMKTDSSGWQQKLHLLTEDLRKAQAERERLSIQVEERETALQTQKQKVFSLQESLTRKEEDLAALEERYKKYIEKAKSVIKSLDPKQGNSSPSEVTILRNQVMEKRKIIEEMERSSKESKLLKETEEKLMLSAFYRLSLACHREAVDQRLAALGQGQGQSFLSRQRQPSSRRAGNPAYNSK